MCDPHGCGDRRDRSPLVVPDAARRAFLKGIAGLPFAAMLFDPLRARAEVDGVQMMEIVSEDETIARGALALPKAERAPAILLIHEWWGLDDGMKAMAAEFAALGYIAFAIDLFDAEPTRDPEAATRLIQGLDASVASNKLAAAIGWLEGHERGTGRIATVGSGFGGGWALNAALVRPVDATVIYYGNVDRTPEQLKTLHGPVLGHFGTQDQNITRDMVDRFAKAMGDAGKASLLQVYWYDADQGFASPTASRYDADDAKLAFDRSREFLQARLAG